MFVVSLIMEGNLIKNAIVPDAGEAIDMANKWYKAYQSSGAKSGYIAIDQEQEGQEENVRFALLQFDHGDSVKLTINNKGGLPTYSSKQSQSIRSYLLPIVEAIVVLAEHLLNRRR